MITTKRALIVGINTYAPPVAQLSGCIADAEAIGEILERNVDGRPNYECRILTDNTEDGKPITRAALRKACTDLFADTKDDVLFYFSGHGALTAFGGYLCAFDSRKDDWGVPMQEIVEMANRSKARDILLIIDCCQSGGFGDPSMLNAGRAGDPLAVIRENMTIIGASLASQASLEAGGHGIFTTAVLDALEGGASDHMGWVTAPSIYAYVERRFGAFDQRPVYKSYSTGVRVIRECAPLIDRLKLHKIVEHFPVQDLQYQLDPEFDPEDEHGNVHEPVNERKVAIAQLFKDYRDAGLLRPSIPGEQLYWTARRGHTVELTLRGREYWWLVKQKKL
jgi:Caspase domain